LFVDVDHDSRGSLHRLCSKFVDSQKAITPERIESVCWNIRFASNSPRPSRDSKALVKAAGNQTRAAVILGITRDTLRYKMKKFSLH